MVDHIYYRVTGDDLLAMCRAQAHFRERAADVAHYLSRIALTPADLAGLADGTRVVVPVEATIAMVDAGIANELTDAERNLGTVSGWQRMYRAMLAARPGAKEG